MTVPIETYLRLYFPFIILLGVFLAPILYFIYRAVKDPAWRHEVFTIDDGSGVLEGVSYEYTRDPGLTRRTPFRRACFEVRVPVKSPIGFELKRHSASDRIAKSTGLCRGGQTGDPDFDRAFYIMSEWPMSASRMFGDGDCRRAVTELFGMGFYRLRLSGGKLEAFMIGRVDPARFRAELVEPVVKLLARIAKAVPAAPVGGESERIAKKHVWQNYTFIYAPVALAVAGNIALNLSMYTYPPLDALTDLIIDWFVWYLFATAVYVGVVLWFRRGRSSAHKHLIWIFLLTFVGVCLAGSAAVIGYNGAADISPPVSHQAQVTDKSTSESRRTSDVHRVRTQSWRTSRASEVFLVDPEIYSLVVPGRTRLQVVTRAGRLGYEWIESYQIIEPDGK